MIQTNLRVCTLYLLLSDLNCEQLPFASRDAQQEKSVIQLKFGFMGQSAVRMILMLMSLFFFWGFVAASNDILIPVLKKKLNLSQGDSQMVSFVFYVAYSVGAMIYVVISETMRRDLLERIGYKNGISIGLLISLLGVVLFIPAADSLKFEYMLSGLFLIGLGFSLQQTAANPLMINAGNPEKGSQRLSMAGGVNNIGTTIGPVLLSLAVFGTVSGNEDADVEGIKMPYIVLGAAILLVAILFRFSKLKNPVLEGSSLNMKRTSFTEILSKPQVWMGMIAIFLYVGVEVATAGNLGELLKLEYGIPANQASLFVSLYWGSLMIGRWTSAAGAMGMAKKWEQVMRIALPFGAFGLFLIVNYMAENEVKDTLPYALVILLVVIGDYLSRGNPARQLVLYSVLGIIALCVGMLTTGMLSIFAFISVGLFCSTLWPCIFTLAIKGLGIDTGRASSLLIMMIMGGGVISVLQGDLADGELGIRYSYVVGIGCFLWLVVYGLSRLRNQAEIE